MERPARLATTAAPDRDQGPPEALLPAAARSVAATVAALCLAVTAFLAVWVTRQTSLNWLDATVDAKAHAMFGAHQRLLAALIWPGGPVPVAAVAVTLAVACLAARRYRHATFVAMAVPTATMLSELVLKPLVGRLMWSSLSFPSGHTTGAFTLAAVLTVLLIGQPGARMPRRLRVGLTLTAFLGAALVAFALIAQGVHYFTDTVAGAATGIGTVLLTALILDLVWPGMRRMADTRRSSSAEP